jgi:alpha-1,3-mannosyltransferase
MWLCDRYPAGFLYVFSVLNWATRGGENVVMAQWIYADFAVLTLALVLGLYFMSEKVRPNAFGNYLNAFHAQIPVHVAAPLLLLSKRVHSIFLLRLFNDPVAMIPLYLSLHALTRARVVTSTLLFSLALSLKMNILLFAPAYALLVLQTTRSLAASVGLAVIAAVVQIALAAPFVAAGFAREYFSRAFEFGRVFMWTWTVNWRFVGEGVFADVWFAHVLVGVHVAVIALFFGKWCGGMREVVGIVRRSLRGAVCVKDFKALDADCKFCCAFAHLTAATDIMMTMFTTNLIGVTFARSLHYQFYSWYFYTLPYLLFRTRLSTN